MTTTRTVSPVIQVELAVGEQCVVVHVMEGTGVRSWRSAGVQTPDLVEAGGRMAQGSVPRLDARREVAGRNSYFRSQILLAALPDSPVFEQFEARSTCPTTGSWWRPTPRGSRT